MKIEVYKPTQDDWNGNFVIQWQGDVKLVRVATMPLRAWKRQPPLWRVCVWGNDDFGMEVDFKTPEEAFQMFNKIIAFEFINKTELFALGFGHA